MGRAARTIAMGVGAGAVAGLATALHAHAARHGLTPTGLVGRDLAQHATTGLVVGLAVGLLALLGQAPEPGSEGRRLGRLRDGVLEAVAAGLVLHGLLAVPLSLARGQLPSRELLEYLQAIAALVAAPAAFALGLATGARTTSGGRTALAALAAGLLAALLLAAGHVVLAFGAAAQTGQGWGACWAAARDLAVALVRDPGELAWLVVGPAVPFAAAVACRVRRLPALAEVALLPLATLAVAPPFLPDFFEGAELHVQTEVRRQLSCLTPQAEAWTLALCLPLARALVDALRARFVAPVT